jgi:hypothetical protein
MTMRSYGLYAEAIIGGLAQVEKLPAVATGSYELRVLQCSEIFLVALWLKGDQGAPDILYPLAPAPHGFQPERPYSADEPLKIARSLIAGPRRGSCCSLTAEITGYFWPCLPTDDALRPGLPGAGASSPPGVSQKPSYLRGESV